MATKVNGKLGKLINEAAELDKAIKEKENRLAEIKKSAEFQALEKDTYITAKGSVLVVQDTYPTTINPLEVYNRLAVKKETQKFWDCIKVVAKNVEAIFSKEEVDELKQKVDKPTKKFMFK